MKVCGKCHIEKDESEFYKRDRGFRGTCKKCISAENRNRISYNGQVRRASKKYSYKNSDSVSDQYVIKQLTKAGISRSLSKKHPELIALKRAQLLVSRIKKQIYGKTN